MQHRRRYRYQWVLAASVVATMSACSSGPDATWTTDSPGLEGLPHEVVAERLADPEFRENLDLTSPDDQLVMIQLQVASTVFCRDLFASYEKWLGTGAAPKTPIFLRPGKPASGFDEFATKWTETFGAAVESGDPEVLRSTLTASGGCDAVVINPSASKRTIGEWLGAQE